MRYRNKTSGTNVRVFLLLGRNTVYSGSYTPKFQTWLHPYSRRISTSPIMEAEFPSETSVHIHQNSRCHISQFIRLHSQHRAAFKSHKIRLLLHFLMICSHENCTYAVSWTDVWCSPEMCFVEQQDLGVHPAYWRWRHTNISVVFVNFYEALDQRGRPLLTVTRSKHGCTSI